MFSHVVMCVRPYKAAKIKLAAVGLIMLQVNHRKTDTPKDFGCDFIRNDVVVLQILRL